MKYALSCVMHKLNNDGRSENWINVLRLVEANNEDEAIGKFLSEVLEENKNHSLFQRPLITKI